MRPHAAKPFRQISSTGTGNGNERPASHATWSRTKGEELGFVVCCRVATPVCWIYLYTNMCSVVDRIEESKKAKPNTSY